MCKLNFDSSIALHSRQSDLLTRISSKKQLRRYRDPNCESISRLHFRRNMHRWYHRLLYFVAKRALQDAFISFACRNYLYIKHTDDFQKHDHTRAIAPYEFDIDFYGCACYKSTYAQFQLALLWLRAARNGASRLFDIARIGLQHLTGSHNFRILMFVARLAVATSCRSLAFARLTINALLARVTNALKY